MSNLRSRITIAYFCLSGLDLLGALESKSTPEQRKGWEEWVWDLEAGECPTRAVNAGAELSRTLNAVISCVE
jgi:hypothetical protein